MLRPQRTVLAGVALGLLFGAFVAEAGYFVAFGRFNIDEGLHLNAGRILFEHGRLLYRDFPFSQGPGGPYLYGVVGALFEPSILVGRAFSLVMNLAGVGAMVLFARRIAGAEAGVLVLAWTIVNLPAVWAYTQIRTEPLSMPLVVIAAIALCLRKQSALQWALAPCLLVWATAIRVTNGLALAAVCLLVALQLRHAPRKLLATGGIVALNAVVAGLPMLVFPRESFFHIIVSQMGRTERFNMGDYPFSTRFWFFVDPHTSFQPLLLLCGLPVVALALHWRRGWRPRAPRFDDPPSVIAMLFAIALLTYLPHVLFRIGFFNYFVTASVLLTLALAISIPMLVRESGRYAFLIRSGIAVCWVAAALQGIDHLDKWVFRERPTINQFEDLRATLHRLSPGVCRMLTFETHIAVEADCDVVPGLEYSFFSFFPDLPAEEAASHAVLSRALLLESFERDPPEFVLLTTRAVELIVQQPQADSKSATVRTLSGERERIRREAGRRRPGQGRPILDVMRGRYELIDRRKVPVGPVHAFWTTVFVYARSDLVAQSGRAGP